MRSYSAELRGAARAHSENTLFLVKRFIFEVRSCCRDRLVLWKQVMQSDLTTFLMSFTSDPGAGIAAKYPDCGHCLLRETLIQIYRKSDFGLSCLKLIYISATLSNQKSRMPGVSCTVPNVTLPDLFWSNVCKCGECPFKRCALQRRVNVCLAIWGCLCSEFSASHAKQKKKQEKRGENWEGDEGVINRDGWWGSVCMEAELSSATAHYNIE